MFSIVLVCLENFQEYILANIAQLFKLGHMHIYVLTNNHLMQEFEALSDIVTLVSVESLSDPFGFNQKSSLNREFRNGFWHLTSSRLFVLHSFMASRPDVTNVIHIENDVLLYYNCDETLSKPLLNERQIYIPFDTFERNVASIIYIPEATTFGKVLSHYDFGKNDMQNFSAIRLKADLIKTLPIFVGRDSDDLERTFVTTGFDKFGFIFDAAAIGQYVGGVDPRNIQGDTRGFINETCIIKYPDEGKIGWRLESGFKKPFIKLHDSGKEVPIFNLHIHSKALTLYC
jgi:hypothetical protein